VSRIFNDSKLVLATHNEGKVEEFKHLFGKKVGFNLLPARDFNWTEPEENGSNFIENALIKAKTAATLSGLVSLADDSGICIECLKDQPGIRSADWGIDENGERNFSLAINKVKESIFRSGYPKPWKAFFTCALILYWPDGHYERFQENIRGEIVWPGRGINGHGYDPIFLPTGYNSTFGEMNRWEKNKISHRGKAMEKMIKACFTDGR
jgi:XTP/dITP diphosphohydrolase